MQSRRHAVRTWKFLSAGTPEPAQRRVGQLHELIYSECSMAEAPAKHSVANACSTRQDCLQDSVLTANHKCLCWESATLGDFTHEGSGTV